MPSPVALLGGLLLLAPPGVLHGPQAGSSLVVGSKSFPESHLLGELLCLLIEERTDLAVEHRAGLGGTLICHTALLAGEIDVYAEYTGTAWAVVLGETRRESDPLRVFLEVQAAYRREHDALWLPPFGFENTYALATTRARAAELGLERISDLRAHPGLRAGVSHEFLERDDGLPGLTATYRLELDARGIEHALAYDALAQGSLDLIDVYSTDGKIERYDLALLEDDRRFFPPYQAAPVVRRAALAAHPELEEVLSALAFRIDADTMRALNARVELEGEDLRAVARSFLVSEGLLEAPRESTDGRNARGSTEGLAGLVLEHVGLTALAVLLAALVALPLGLAGVARPALARASLAAASILQTVPSLALLAFLIAVPGLGLTWRAAVVALFLYAVLPILRNTISGLTSVDADLIDAARGIGLRDREILLRVRLPLAVRPILAGVRTATVISVGVATLAAFIGAGGLGQRIVTGLYLNDTELILSGAVPAAGLALVADFLLGRVERRLTPRGLRR